MSSFAPKLPSDVTSMSISEGSFGANYDNLTYLKLRKNSTAIENTTPDLSVIIKEIGNILKIFEIVLDELNSPRVIFTQFNKIYPTELMEGEAT